MSNIIVIAFSPRIIVGCFLKKGLQRGVHGHPRIPPRYTLATTKVMVLLFESCLQCTKCSLTEKETSHDNKRMTGMLDLN